MNIGIAADHGGFELKGKLIDALHSWGHEVIDFGALSFDPADDYPDFVIPLAEAVAAGEVERGVAICSSGIGASVAANKVAGVRAALIHDAFSARQGVEDDAMNVLCLGARVTGPSLALDLLRIFLQASFSDAERHRRRLAKVAALEKGPALREEEGSDP
jgi:ribose 5-phosphate isomerase B